MLRDSPQGESLTKQKGRYKTMKIHILGSGGGEGIPSLFCHCANCDYARKHGGKNIRTLCQTLINDDLLLDFSYDTPRHFENGICVSDIENILITHSDEDHFFPYLFSLRGAWGAYNMKKETVHVHGNATVTEMLETAKKGFYPDVANGIITHCVNSRTEIIVGKYTVFTLHAKHSPKQEALNFVISDGEKAVLYMVDSGYPDLKYFDRLIEIGLKLDCVIMDCASGNIEPAQYPYHSTAGNNAQFKKVLEEMGLVNENCKFIATHFTHSCAPSQEEMERLLSPYGIIAAYDGMTIEI